MPIRVAVIDYGAGNLRSVAKGLETVAEQLPGQFQIMVTGAPDTVYAADSVVLPGVGAFGQCASSLRSIDGMVEALDEVVIRKGQPFLGICVGMQLMAKRGLERGDHAGLGWIPGEVIKLDPDDPHLKVPHMGWSQVSQKLSGLNHEILGKMNDNGEAYFVHSFHFEPDDPRDILATCDYGQTVAAIVGRDNLLGTQFHPEKSQTYGLEFLWRFLNWKP